MIVNNVCTNLTTEKSLLKDILFVLSSLLKIYKILMSGREYNKYYRLSNKSQQTCQNSHSPTVPEQWIKCPRKSFTAINNKFVAFKTPLDSKYDEQIPARYRFNTEMLFSSLVNEKINLGLWIDLTNTCRYYNGFIIKGYVKLPCKGHYSPPTKEQTKLFIKICSKFVAKNPLQCIGVHCTHGFNRTGFMIITYLIEELHFNVTSAITHFAAARPPGIYKQVYIDELYRRYSKNEKPILAPKPPDWCKVN
ncbi:mRNA-capping enzyme-like [Sipha flava]|uniref:mRNA-capping enzyme-like n=1 Tax=Sipha flava TaxID=143950 RepID=A0A8B8FJZ4_9HEMI|nr:mRNA-capping enzyme-like [Sipha flava]